MNRLTQKLVDEQATEAFGVLLSQCLRAPLIVYLSGPLGAGKSTLVRSLLRSLGVTGAIKSPTYALVEPYSFSSYSIYHFDFYRFFDENEWEESGFRDYFGEKSICLLEWPEKARAVLPVADLEISLSYCELSAVDQASYGRQITIEAKSQQGESILGVLTGKRKDEFST